MVEREFNRLLEATSYLSHSLDFNYCNSKPVSLGQSMEWIIKLQEKNVKEKQIQHWKEIIQLQDKLKANQNRISTVADKVEELQKEYLELEAVDNRDVTKEFAFRAKARDLNNACKEFDKLKEDEKSLTKVGLSLIFISFKKRFLTVKNNFAMFDVQGVSLLCNKRD